MDRLLLNVCCAPCALPIIDYLINVEKRRLERFSLYFYGPNIYPEAEYLKRLEEVRRIAVQYGINFIEGGYDHNSWLVYLKERL
ncbi:MAG: epoxyqueuosine reductase QueH, partial [Candidatus Margulisbacteria bacterium]|nr:epoxyqueuosine reductase QueH [Candidatus Margulisiibacteriota bacterium]